MNNTNNKKKWFILAIAFLFLMIVGLFIALRDKSTSTLTNQESAITGIRKFMGDDSLKIEYINESTFAYDENMAVAVYVSEFDQFEINSKTGKLLQFGPKPSSIKNYDETSRYAESELEVMARDYLAKNAPEVNLTKLVSNGGNKGQEHYFFRWEDRSRNTTEGYPFIQVGFSRGGSVLGYINALGL